MQRIISYYNSLKPKNRIAGLRRLIILAIAAIIVFTGGFALRDVAREMQPGPMAVFLSAVSAAILVPSFAAFVFLVSQALDAATGKGGDQCR